jgi:hypothetical protein
VKPVRWSAHALRNLADREIDRRVADATLETAAFAVSDGSGRRILMRRNLDDLLQREMRLRVVIEETAPCPQRGVGPWITKLIPIARSISWSAFEFSSGDYSATSFFRMSRNPVLPW